MSIPSDLYYNPLCPTATATSSDGSIWRTSPPIAPSSVLNLSVLHHKWAWFLYSQMRENFWIPQKIDLSADSMFLLSTDEQFAFKGVLSYLAFLDSLQTCNIPHLALAVSSPEIRLCLTEQASQEAMHSISYQYIIESLVPVEERESLYIMYTSLPVLSSRCTAISSIYEQSAKAPSSAQTYVRSLVACYLLEGIFFHSGFMFFYTLASRHLMGGVADIIRLIHRDELSHVRLFQQLVRSALEVFSFDRDEVALLFETAVDLEIATMKELVGDRVLGITCESTDIYIKHIANERLRAIGFSALYTEEKYKRSPYAHLERMADPSKEAGVKVNFFESTVSSYQMSSVLEDWSF